MESFMPAVLEERGWESRAAGHREDAGLLSGLLGAYQEQGYEQGHRRGVADVLASLLLLTEEFLSQQEDPDPRLRRLFHQFGDYVEANHAPRRGAEFFNGGLGI